LVAELAAYFGGGGGPSDGPGALQGPVFDLAEQALAWRRAADAHLRGGSLHKYQAEALAHVILRRDVFFLLAPTGGGKSLAFQLASLAEPQLTVVVSPLRALIESQTGSLQRVLDALPLGGGGRAMHSLRDAPALVAAEDAREDLELNAWEDLVMVVLSVASILKIGLERY